MRSKKEGGFIWAIWHKTMVVNSWMAIFIAFVDDKCHMCASNIPETLVHEFWDYRITIWIRDYSTGITNKMWFGLGKRNLGELLIDIMASFGEKFLHPFAKPLKFGWCFMASHFGLFGLKGMTLCSTIVDGMKIKCKETFGKVFYSMLENICLKRQ